jgi:DNA mismatch repair ATPase MutS
MAQIGYFVTASNAKLRMTGKIFSRIGFQDSIEQGANSFAVELREMEFENKVSRTDNGFILP